MKQFRNRYFLLVDIVLLAVAAFFSYVLRLETVDLGSFWPGLLVFAALGVVTTPLVFIRTGIYSRYWKYATAEDGLLLLVSVTLAVVLTSILSWSVDALLPDITLVPRSIPMVFLLLAVTVTTGPRLMLLLTSRHPRGTWSSLRILRRWLIPHRPVQAGQGAQSSTGVLLMGAGAAGSMIARELQRNPQLGMHAVGFLDDDPAKQGAYIHSTPVLGTRNDLAAVVEQYGVQRVIIAMPTAPGKVIREIVRVCEDIDVETKIIPGIYELLGGHVSVSQLRNVEVEDLLRREPVQTDTSAVQQMVEAKTILVLGAGGSIGSELCRQLLRLKPARLILLGHGENSIFEIYNEITRIAGRQATENVHRAASTEIIPVIADLRHAERIRVIMQQHRPQIVFHAAAHKHVPLMEENPCEAITNNVLGTRIVLEASMQAGVERFVLISTDKAVNPSSVMGASKRVAELLVHEAATQTCKPYVAVRFGNVLGSRGSVVLTFKQQIAAGGPVTVTHKDMMRYFMTIPEAVQLVLQAATLGKGGEVFMLDMGEPVKIEDLAKDLIELSGLQVGRDIDIEYSGIRPGEKLYEDLFVKGETYGRTRHDKIFVAANASSLVPANLAESIAELERRARNGETDSVISGLREVIPNYRPSGATAGEGVTRKARRPGNRSRESISRVVANGANEYVQDRSRRGTGPAGREPVLHSSDGTGGTTSRTGQASGEIHGVEGESGMKATQPREPRVART